MILFFSKWIFSDVGKNQDAYEVVLNPGDILIVPANWWHYVENLNTSLTINTWIPLVSALTDVVSVDCYQILTTIPVFRTSKTHLHVLGNVLCVCKWSKSQLMIRILMAVT